MNGPTASRNISLSVLWSKRNKLSEKSWAKKERRCSCGIEPVEIRYTIKNLISKKAFAKETIVEEVIENDKIKKFKKLFGL